MTRKLAEKNFTIKGKKYATVKIVQSLDKRFQSDINHGFCGGEGVEVIEKGKRHVSAQGKQITTETGLVRERR